VSALSSIVAICCSRWISSVISHHRRDVTQWQWRHAGGDVTRQCG